MLLRSIELKNFRQFVDEKIDFSVDTDRNVTLIIGENGTGKTTFAQAFFWCFYGETSFTDKSVVNRHVFEKMSPEDETEVKVAIKLSHGEVEYEVTRTQVYRKNYSNKSLPENTKVLISKKDTKGNTTYVDKNKNDDEIAQILPKDLSPYFFFDGEKIEKMSKEIIGNKKSASFAEAVSGLTGLKAIGAAIRHLGVGRSSVIGKFNDEYVDASDGKMQDLTNQINNLESEIESAEKQKSDLEDNIASAKEAKAKSENDIKTYAEGERLQGERDNLNKQINSAKNLKSQMINGISRDFNSDMTSFFSLSLAKRAMELVNKSDFNGKDIPNMHADTIKYLLDKRTCICGTRLDEGTIPCQKVHELLEYLPPHSIGVAVKNFVSNVRGRFCNKVTLMDKTKRNMDMIVGQDDIIDECEEALNDISKKLDGKDVRQQVRELSERIKACDKIISQSTSNREALISKIAKFEERKSQLENSRS